MDLDETSDIAVRKRYSVFIQDIPSIEAELPAAISGRIKRKTATAVGLTASSRFIMSGILPLLCPEQESNLHTR
jgi:hypothetical protein